MPSEEGGVAEVMTKATWYRRKKEDTARGKDTRKGVQKKYEGKIRKG